MKTQSKRPLIPGWFAAMIAFSLLITVWGTTHRVQPDSQDVPQVAAGDPQGQGLPELLDVFWVDSYPEVSSDTWNAYLFSSDNVGLHIQAHSAYKLTIELFEFKGSDKNLSFHFPHDSRRTSSNYTIEKMKKPTKHFDTQLTLQSDPQQGGKTGTYFTGPEFRSLDGLPPVVRESLLRQGLVQETEDGLSIVH